MQRFDVLMLVSPNAPEGEPELGKSASEGSWIAREGVERGEAVGEDGENERGEVGGKGAFQVIRKDCVRSKEGKEGRRNDEKDGVDRNAVRLVLAEDLVRDLESSCWLSGWAVGRNSTHQG